VIAAAFVTSLVVKRHEARGPESDRVQFDEAKLLATES
jgi:hypothetical protein